MSETTPPAEGEKPGGPQAPTGAANDGKLRRALTIGARLNAFYWSGSQAHLTQSAEVWVEAHAILREVTAVLVQKPGPDSAKATELLDRAWAICDRAFSSKDSFLNTARVFNLGLHLQRPARAGGFAHDVIAAREEWLKGFVTREQLRAFVFKGWDREEMRAFELGEIIDQGVRPQNAHRQMEIPDGSAGSMLSPPAYLGSRCFQPGELPPDGLWSGHLEEKWQAVFGYRINWKQFPEAFDGFPNEIGARCALVARIEELALDLAGAVNSESPRCDAKGSEGGPAARAYVAPPASVVENPFPLTFKKEDGTYWVRNALGERANFKRAKQQYEIARFLHERTHTGGKVKAKKAFEKFWPAETSRTKCDQNLRTATSDANVLLGRIRCQIERGDGMLWVQACVKHE